MAFQPRVDQVLTIERMPYRIAAHPSAPGMAYGQEGRQGIVYQLLGDDGAKKALKVFKPRFRLPALVSLSERLGAWAGLEGLQVCRRTVLTPQRHTELLRQHPDLTYAVLMPWVEGPTWMEVLLSKRVLTPAQSLALARALAGVLAVMEQEGVAHCDLSGPNVLVLPSPPRSGVALVDVEQLYAPDLRRPSALPGGSPGYAHSTAPDGLWAPEADRFAGAVLLAEMLCWCDGRVREAAWGESYFDPAEVQAVSRRYRVLRAVLAAQWGDVAAGLFERAWRSDTLSDCATFGEWLLALPERVGAAAGCLQGGLPEEEAPPERAGTEALASPPAAPAPQGQAHEPEVEQPAPAPEAGLLAVVHDSEEAELAALFDEGVAACERGDWQLGVELLAEVVRRRPGYAWGGKRAQELLGRAQVWAERQGRTEAKTPGRTTGLAVLFGCGMLVLALFAVMAMGGRQRAQVAATQTAVAVAMIHEASLLTATPRPTMTATATNTPVPSRTSTAMSSATPQPPTLAAAPTSVPTTAPRSIPFTGLASGRMAIAAGNSPDRVHIFVLEAGSPSWLQIASSEYHDRHPAWSPAGDRIAFDSYQDGQDWIIISAPDGSNANRVVGGVHPSWSPDGTRLVFEGVGLFTLDLATGQRSQNLVPEMTARGWVGSPSWSPDGRWVAFMAYTTYPNTGIYLVPPEGGQARALIADANWSASGPAWSPDGSQVAFWSDMTGTQALYVLGVNDSTPKKVIDFPGDSGKTYSSLCWSPDSQSIVFVGDADLDGFPDVYSVAISRSTIARLTDNRQYRVLLDPSLSP